MMGVAVVHYCFDCVCFSILDVVEVRVIIIILVDLELNADYFQIEY